VQQIRMAKIARRRIRSNEDKISHRRVLQQSRLNDIAMGRLASSIG
jgi:hypothetical protein